MKSEFGKFKRALALVLVVLLSHPGTLAQFPPDEFLGEDDFDAPPPPPPGFPPPPADDTVFNPPPPPPPDDFGNPPPPPPDNTGSNGSGGSGGGKSAGSGSGKIRARPPISQAQPEDITNENYPELIDSFDYPNAEITDVIKAISELTGKNFIIDPGVRGKITIIAPSKVTVAEAYRAFLSALAINGFTVVPSGKFLKIRSARDAQRENIETYSGSYAPDTDQMITRIIHLKHISASEVVKSLRMLPSKNGEVYPYEPTNSIIISDFGSNVERVMAILRELDVPGFEEQMEVITIKHAKAKDIADLMDKIINKGESKSRQGAGFSTGIPRFGQPAAKASNEAFSLVIPDDRTNSIIVVGNRAGIQKIRNLVAKLDRRIRADEAGGVYVYYVKHGDAEKIAQTLSGLAQDSNKAQSAPSGGASPIPGGAFIPPQEQAKPLFGGEVKITASKDTNSLIVTASKQDYVSVLNLLRKIDIPRDQVYVEVAIMEMSADNQNSFGISYYQFVPESKGTVRAGFSSFEPKDFGALLSPTGSNGALLGFGRGETFDFTAGGQTVKITSQLGLVNFLKGLSNVNILSTPQILALDNEDAEIEVGDTIPTGVSTTLGNTGTVASPQKEDATIKLKVKAQISKTDDTIRLKFQQSVKGISQVRIPAEALAASSVSISTRRLDSNLVIRSGDTAVLGGLMKDQEVQNVTKVPLLGDIPILGWLFKGKNTKRTKVNLVVLLTPTVIRNQRDSRKLLGEKLNERVDFIKSSMGGRDPFGKKLQPIQDKAKAASSSEVNPRPKDDEVN